MSTSFEEVYKGKTLLCRLTSQSVKGQQEGNCQVDHGVRQTASSVISEFLIT